MRATDSPLDHLGLDDLDVRSELVELPGQPPDLDATVAVVGMPGAGPIAMVLASMRRGRRAEHEELHAQLFVDDVFVDAVRAAEVELGAPLEHATFVARFRLPAEYFDGRRHRACVAFGASVSRVVPKGEGSRAPEAAPELVAAADFVARRAPLARTGT